MKKCIAILILALIFLLCACNSLSGDPVSDNPSASSNNTSLSADNTALPQPFEVVLTVDTIPNSGKPLFEISSNLPDNTELLLTLEGPPGFNAQDTITLQNGQGKSSAFSAQGAPLSGTYTLRVTMGVPTLQDQSVQAVIGSNGEYMAGDHVKQSFFAENKYNSIEAEYSFTFGSEDYLAALQKIADGQYDDAKKLLERLNSDYCLSNELITNMDKLQTLLENTWVNRGFGWSYFSTFSVVVSGEEISLLNYEREYSGNELIGEYNDIIDLEDLLDDGNAKVYSGSRDNFTLDINNILNGKILRFNEWVDAVYQIGS